MTPARLLIELRRLGVYLEPKGTKLRFVAPAGALTDELYREMQEHKADLLAVLKEHGGLPYDCERAVV